MDELKKCVKCGIEKSRAEFNKHHKGAPDGLRYDCKACYAKYQRQWKDNNQERLNEIARNWRAETLDKRRAYTRDWYQKNKPRLQEKARKWVNQHRDYYKIISRNRKARELGSFGTHTTKDIKALHVKQKGRCAYCQKKLGDSYHVDHVIALAKGGGNDILNIQLLCPTCNLRKHDRDPIEFAQSIGLLL